MNSDSSVLDTKHRSQRMLQLVWVVSGALTLSALQHLIAGRQTLVPIVLLGAVVLLAGARLLLTRGHLDVGMALMLGTLTAMLGFFVARGEGLRDPALLGFPSVLVFAALHGDRRLFRVLVVASVAALVGVGAATLLGLRSDYVRPLAVSDIIDVCVILLVSSFSIALLSRDLAGALARLAAENLAVSESKRHIEFLATRDALTGLHNRAAARDHFDLAVAQARRQGGKVALLYLDLDHFKNVNDSLGHPAGDELLRCMAQRLAGCARAGDTVSRLGGDEYLLLLRQVDDGEVVADVALRALRATGSPTMLSGIEVQVSASLGIALFPDDGGDFDSLLKKADIAMYRAKDSGRNAFRFFDAQMNAGVAEHLQLVAGIRTALARGEFQLHYQPQVDLDSGHIVGAEALIRWQHPERGMISPAEFIPVAEQSGQIVEIGAWVLAQACRQAAEWQRSGFAGLAVSVNLSPVQARRGDLERAVVCALEDSGLPAGLLELELTETLLIEESEQLSATLGRLRARGIAFSIDDFGTGYSNLAYLKRFEVERLKIDQSFVRRLITNADDEAIVRAILQMAAALRLGVIAEGIEDEATLCRLRELGCAQGQGFYWSPALPPERFAAFVAANRRRASSLDRPIQPAARVAERSESEHEPWPVE
jgi:diguanylate cyclase (GGDEF)-like protein